MSTTPPSVVEFAFPGPLRDRLVAAVLAGTKTSTTGLLAEYQQTGEPLAHPGDQATVIDSEGTAVGVIQTVAIRVTRLAEVDLPHAIDEGEGFTDVAGWRATHEALWRSPAWQAELGPGLAINDDTAVVLERFVLIKRL